MTDFARIVKRKFSVDLSTIKHDITTRRDPDEFPYVGSQMFHGMQGEGKTVSMYYHAFKIWNTYKRSIIVSNLNLSNLQPINPYDIEHISNLELSEPGFWSSRYIKAESFEDIMYVLRKARNGKYGVIFMIDEIHNYFHSHDSKATPMWVVQVFSQQRKQHLVILGTVQDWNDLTKIIRTQAKNLILCHKVGYFITQTVVDPRMAEVEYGEVFFAVKKKGFFFLSKAIRDGMDTYQVIDSGRSVMGGNEITGIKKNKDGTFDRPRKHLFQPAKKVDK